MVLLLIGALSCAVAAGYLAVVEVAGSRGTRASLARVAGYGRRTAEAAVVEERHERRLVGLLARIALRVAPGRDRAKTAARLQAAGLAHVGAEVFLAGKTGVAAAGFLLGLLFGAGIGGPTSAIALAFSGLALGFVVPDMLLGAKAKSRREQILEDLPNALDLLAVTVEAGLGLDASLARYADTAQGPLADELALLVTELRVGGSRADVLRRLGDRVPAPETKSFVRAIAHADHLGVSLSSTLRSQAQDVRLRRQAVAEERANKAPVKMLFPTVFCIFPTLFVVVLGPALISLFQAL